MDMEAVIHFVGGAMGGTAGTAITCPLEVVKTRLQSSSYASSSSSGPSTSKNGVVKSARNFHGRSNFSRVGHAGSFALRGFPRRPPSTVFPTSDVVAHSVRMHSSSPIQGFWHRKNIFKLFHRIIKEEGIGALYKGLVPNLIGVAPSKAVYFYTYSTCKRLFNDVEVFVPNSAMVHMVSAASAGFVAATVVNPIWLVKTRLQLYKGPMTVAECIKRVYMNEGPRGFYRGVTASYVGVSETVIQFVIYEHLRGMLVEAAAQAEDDDRRNKLDFVNFMLAGGSARFIACIAAYPHEVVRTRLREENSIAKGFFSTLFSLYKNEGFLSLYRGLAVQLLRTVPNTAITMGTYEVVVYFLHQLRVQ